MTAEDLYRSESRTADGSTRPDSGERVVREVVVDPDDDSNDISLLGRAVWVLSLAVSGVVLFIALLSIQSILSMVGLVTISKTSGFVILGIWWVLVWLLGKFLSNNLRARGL